MSFRMRINSENPRRTVSKPIPIPAPTEKPVQKYIPTPVETYHPAMGSDGRPTLTKQTNKYFTGYEKTTEKSEEPAKSEQFVVGDDTVVYDEESGLWKIK